jgi:hypothetical protein
MTPPKSRGVEISRLATQQDTQSPAAPDETPLATVGTVVGVEAIERTNISASAKPLTLGVVDAVTVTDETPAEAREDVPTRADEAPALCLRVPDLVTDLTFDTADSNRDAKIRALMAAGDPQIVVDLSAPSKRDAPPAGMSPWLQAVQRSGGQVDTTPIECVRKRGLFKAIGAIYRKLTGAESRERLFDVAKDYNATLYYDASGMLVRQIVFNRREK